MSYESKPHHRRYYMPSEVAQHCSPEDCWLSWFGDVYDLSPLLTQHQGESAHMDKDTELRTPFRNLLRWLFECAHYGRAGIETKPIIDSAGQDITHWFDKETVEVIFVANRGRELHP